MDYENMYFSKVENIVMIDYEGVARIFQMSQTVPTGNCYIPDPYAAYADSFDLSLLPSSSSSSVTASVTTATTNDCEVPLSPQSELSSIILPSSESLISTSSQSQLVSLDYIPTTIYNDQPIKIEKPWNQEDTNNNNNNNTNNYNNNSRTNTPTIINTVEIAQQTITDTSILLQQLQKQYQFYPSPLPSPPQDFSLSSPVPSINSTGIYPPSPCSTIEQTYQNFQIKQEYHILPPSPPESNGAPSPACIDIKCEPDTDTEQLIDIDSLLEKSLQSSQSLSSPQSPLSPLQSSNQSSSSSLQQNQQQKNIKKPVQDHQLLREYLQDTSFQKKHNLKPLALESLIGGLGVRGDIEPVISLALEYAKRDAQATCAILKISPDPQQWTTSQVHAWIRSTIEQFKLPQIDNVEIKFPEDGSALICLTEDEFQRRIPEAGSTIHAQLEIWKLACSENFQTTISSSTSIIDLTTQIGPSTSTTNWNSNNCSQNMDISDDENEEMIPTSATKASAIPQPPPPPPLSTSSSSSSSSPLSTSAIVTGSAATTIENGITGTSTVTVTSSTKNTTGTTTGTGNITKSGPGTRPGSSHIHLWQFLKELLSTPQINGTAIRWLDRNKGVFKIEDSVRVAKLWGRRKNRPAMNYDKLSRSIRQYYKKGIMKKTERSQRLVYQFCHPYCL